MLEPMLDRIGDSFALQQRDPGEFASFRAGALKVSLQWRTAVGLGNVSLLSGSAMGGLMKLETLVIDPFARDLPLFSCDWVAAPGKRTLLAEYYDTLLHPENLDAAPLETVRSAASGLRDLKLGSHWYDPIRLSASFAKQERPSAQMRLLGALLDALEAWLSIAEKASALPPEERTEKKKKAAAYVDGLLSHGGPSTDAFLKALGPERTREIFAKVVFGTAV
jgi:hypothetical protein